MALKRLGYSFLLSVLLSAGTLSTGVAQAETALVDGFAPDQVLAQQAFTGAPGRNVEAFIVSTGADNNDLMVIHTIPGDVRAFVAARTSALWIDAGSELATNSSGSLLVRQGSDVGRGRWYRTITIAYRDGAYRLVGFTYYHFDTFNGRTTSCDYNLLTGTGVKNTQPVLVRAEQPLVNNINTMNREQLFSCDNW